MARTLAGDQEAKGRSTMLFEIFKSLRDAGILHSAFLIGVACVIFAIVGGIPNLILPEKSRKRLAAFGLLLVVLSFGGYIYVILQVEDETLVQAPTSTIVETIMVSIPTETVASTIVPTLSPTESSPVPPTITPTPTTMSPIAECSLLNTSLTLNANLTTCAWEFFNKMMYEEAIAVAKECIDTFEAQALREQQEFTASGSTTPPVGTTSESEKNEIMSRGVLNDVATCYFVKGRALENLDRISEAKVTYIGAQQFPDARTWDENMPGFWSTAQAASERFARLP